MADISKITVGTTTYNLKDASARSSISTINSAGYQTASQVTTAINNAISGITGIRFEVVSALPTTGTAGTIYLIAHQHTTQDIYDEYIYVNGKWEKLGTTDMDLSNYVTKSDIASLTNSEIDSIVV